MNLRTVGIDFVEQCHFVGEGSKNSQAESFVTVVVVYEFDGGVQALPDD